LKSSNHQKYSGLLLLDKPIGMTSHQAVGFLRRKLKMKQIGHAGTLDPMATGLLILMVGKATKTSQYLVLDNKTYQGTIKLGEVSNTYDSEGTITQVSDPSKLTKEEIQNAALTLSGKQLQLPPMFSAVKINGQPLYLAARAGETIEREPREINVYHFKITDNQNPNLEFEISCSKGTYIRTLSHQIGELLKCGSYLTSLRRTQSGDFNLDNSATQEKIESMEEEDIAKLLLPYEHYIPQKPLAKNNG
jgi:tRNA pseudouridine55 synthase